MRSASMVTSADWRSAGPYEGRPSPGAGPRRRRPWRPGTRARLEAQRAREVAEREVERVERQRVLHAHAPAGSRQAASTRRRRASTCASAERGARQEGAQRTQVEGARERRRRPRERCGQVRLGAGLEVAERPRRRRAQPEAARLEREGRGRRQRQAAIDRNGPAARDPPARRDRLHVERARLHLSLQRHEERRRGRLLATVAGARARSRSASANVNRARSVRSPWTMGSRPCAVMVPPRRSPVSRSTSRSRPTNRASRERSRSGASSMRPRTPVRARCPRAGAPPVCRRRPGGAGRCRRRSGGPGPGPSSAKSTSPSTSRSWGLAGTSPTRPRATSDAFPADTSNPSIDTDSPSPRSVNGASLHSVCWTRSEAERLAPA